MGNKEKFLYDISIIICIILILSYLFGCSSLPIPADKKCKATNLAGDMWANNDVTSILTFNDDCSGLVKKCDAYFTYEVIDFNTVYINVDNLGVPRPKGTYNCPNA